MGRIIILITLIIGLFGCSPINKILKSTDYEYKLKKANELFTKKKYSQAVLVYEDIFPVLKGTAPFEDLYWNYALSHYNLRDYLNAENLFKGFIENFPNSPKSVDAAFYRAFSYYKQSPKPDLDQTPSIKAINAFQTFIMRNPGSTKNKEATDIIDELRGKLEEKERRAAELYYNLGFFKASATAYSQLMFNFPDSDKGEKYKLMEIKSYYDYAKKSIFEKQIERYEKVLDECADFRDRFPESTFIEDVVKFKNQSENKIKSIKNEQIKTSG